MKINYRGHEITVTREHSMAGYSLLYYSVFRVADGYECMSSFEDSNEKVGDMVGILKERIDAELASDDPWGEKEAKGEFDEVIA